MGRSGRVGFLAFPARLSEHFDSGACRVPASGGVSEQTVVNRLYSRPCNRTFMPIRTVCGHEGMNLVDHDGDYGRKVWLSREEVNTLLDSTKNSERRIGFGLAALCGLRTQEVLDVSPDDVVETDAGIIVRVRHGKGDKYRETPCPATLATTIRTVDDYRDETSDAPVVGVTSTRGLRKWMERRREKLADETGEDGWRHLSWHDLRRTWASALSDCEVSDRLVMQWGGWEDLETFLDHYEGKYSPEAQKREREKVEWLS